MRGVLHVDFVRACSCPMKLRRSIIFLLAGLIGVVNADISPKAVAILCNSAVPESRKLAEIYRQARGIPRENIIELELPQTADISRETFQKKILVPLRGAFDNRGWWERQKDAGGIVLPVMNQIQVLVAMRGVPLRIEASPKSSQAANPQNPMMGHDEASVDSELAMFGVEGLPIDSVLVNKFHLSTKSFAEARLPFLVLTARIDAPTFATCERMIRDAIEVEKTGLWGRAYVDIANKVPQGDQWLEAIVKTNGSAGIPTVADRFNETLPKNYPMTDASLYYGWYDWHVSGPFLNPGFRFRKGAVAMHLHSFSAEQLNNADKNWSGPLLERGAAVTVGNVYEPYLHLTHDFGTLHNRLVAGHTWVEACWMAMPVTSWQGVALGDPLYRPFLHINGSGARQDADLEFRALRAAGVEWKTNLVERQKQLEKAAERMQSGVLAEAVGLEFSERKQTAQAVQWYGKAKGYFVKIEDKLRQDMHLIASDRAAGRKDAAVQGLRDAELRYGPIVETDALRAWKELVNPTPPPKNL